MPIGISLRCTDRRPFAVRIGHIARSYLTAERQQRVGKVDIEHRYALRSYRFTGEIPYSPDPRGRKRSSRLRRLATLAAEQRDRDRIALRTLPLAVVRRTRIGRHTVLGQGHFFHQRQIAAQLGCGEVSAVGKGRTQAHSARGKALIRGKHQRKAQITANDYRAVVHRYSDARAHRTVQILYIVAVALSSDSAEIGKVLPHLRRCKQHPPRKLARACPQLILSYHSAQHPIVSRQPRRDLRRERFFPCIQMSPPPVVIGLGTV